MFHRRGLLASIVAFAALSGLGTAWAGAPEPIRVLFFSRTEGFRHDSIPDAKLLFENLDPSEGIETTITEETDLFTDAGLADFDVVMFVNTTGDVLDPPEQEALQRFVRSGRGFVGVHSAADTEHQWPWYGDLVGAFFTSHALLSQYLEVTTEDRDHPSTAHLPAVFHHQDEWYNYDRNPRFTNRVLLTINPDSRPGYTMGEDHPCAWYKEFEGGRSWYTNLGHRRETWRKDYFIRHLLEGIRWAAHTPTWNRIVLSTRAKNPVALDVAGDGRVFFIELTGEVLAWLPETGRTIVAAALDVDTKGENGLLGVVLDPDFETNGWIYLYHSLPARAEGVPGAKHDGGEPGENVLSRYTVLPDSTLDMGSEVDLLTIPSARVNHEAGGLDIGPDGTLYLSVGDNTIPFGDSLGFAPIDQRPGRELYNALRTAPNPFDPRGKILRINRDGTIPAGNLFPADGSQGLPEIYVMGSRNPFRVAVDSQTGRLYWGDVGPDAPVGSPIFGPRGYDELNFADGPGHYGWPFCIADNFPYRERDFADPFQHFNPGPYFSCAGYVPAFLYYDYTTRYYRALGTAMDRFDTLGLTGRTAIAGTFYRAAPGAPFALPAPWRDTLFMADYTREVVASVALTEDDKVDAVRPFLPWEEFLAPIDLDTGPDGALYVLEYGAGLGSSNFGARVSRIEYSETGALTPVAQIDATPEAGPAPLDVAFDGAASRAPGKLGSIVAYEWDLDGDAVPDETSPSFHHVFTMPGTYTVSLVVESDAGRRSYPATREIVVGNSPPEVEILSPADGTAVGIGETVHLEGQGSDAEDGAAPCEDLAWDIRLGHNSHSHPIETLHGCTAEFVADLGGHDQKFERIFYVVELRYTDQGGPGGASPLTARSLITIDVPATNYCGALPPGARSGTALACYGFALAGGAFMWMRRRR
ncbi:MAG: ThuA domain-containing protein [Myxococcales bacterium]|nr:ThuA domain-containing protein [Myxococcales bacterium]